MFSVDDVNDVVLEFFSGWDAGYKLARVKRMLWVWLGELWFCGVSLSKRSIMDAVVFSIIVSRWGFGNSVWEVSMVVEKGKVVSLNTTSLDRIWTCVVVC